MTNEHSPYWITLLKQDPATFNDNIVRVDAGERTMLRGADLSGIDLTEAHLDSCDLSFADLSGAKLPAEEIVARACSGDAACEATLARYEERLARALAGVINIVDPDVIVLGGGLSNVERLYANVPRLWGRHVFSDEVRTRLVPPRHGDSSDPKFQASRCCSS